MCICKHLYCQSENKSQNAMVADSLSRLATKENALHTVVH